MPHWALGDLMDLAIDLAGMTRSLTPPVGRKAIVTMAGDHGVTVEGVSKFPKEVTPQMVLNFLAGGSGTGSTQYRVNGQLFSTLEEAQKYQMSFFQKRKNRNV